MSSQPAAAITAREAEILALVGARRSNAEIGAELFISVRTVESHVSSLLRKLGVADRRALADVAAEVTKAERTDQALAGLPAPPSRFIGRAKERSALRDAVGDHRHVTAVGPGGVGKTRLALAVATDLVGDFPDGVWFVDLVPVTDPAMVASAVAAALGVGDQPGRTIDESVVSALADRRVLLVLDNCEHLAEGVAPFAERLLAHCPYVRVLATSRARLMVPFEWAYSVPPLSLDGFAADGTSSDAVELFLARAAAVDCTIDADRLDQVAEVCRKLDGVALAIELAAARLPALGLDGLLGGLSDHLRLLVGGYRADDRHRSVRAMLDWSQALLADPDLALLRRVSVFASPFTASDAAGIAGFSPLEPDDIANGLARLTEQSLLSVIAFADGTRYRVLETIRQYGAEQLTSAGDVNATRARHLHWCLAAASDLTERTSPAAGAWRTGFDAVADDLRAGLGWAAEQPDQRADAHRLALLLAQLAFARNLIGESQQRYEQAATLASDPADMAAALRCAANVAACRMRGDDAYWLWQAAADLARRTDDLAGASRDLATAATTYFRKSGAFAQLPTRDAATALLDRARELAGDDPAAQTAVELGECIAQGYAYFAEQAGAAPAAEMTARAEQVVELARQLDDPLAESAALHALTGAHRRVGDTFAAAATARRRVELLDGAPVTPGGIDELIDALLIATATSIGVGDLPNARRWGRQLRDLPQLAEVGHVATSRLLMADALAGHACDVIAASGRFLDGWTRAGRPPARHLGPVAASVAMIHGLRGDRAAESEWLAVLEQLGVTSGDRAGYSPTFDAIALLHHENAPAALERLSARADEPNPWSTGILLQWHLALRAEAAVLAHHPDASDHLTAARPIAAGNPVATALLDRATALLDNDRERVLATGQAFETAGCPYQQARTLILGGPDTAAIGRATLTDLGLTPADRSP